VSVDTDPEDLAAALAAAARAQRRTVAVAESLTGGQVSSALAAAEEASVWFRGGVVAYASDVKHEVLHVRPGCSGPARPSASPAPADPTRRTASPPARSGWR
jgi:nicotinamide-nucleotide amidase